MLGKLTKYEFLATTRTFLPLYGALLVVSLLQGFMIRSDRYHVPGILDFILPMVLGSLFLALVVITIMVTIRRFATMLGDEGYLMFTLPVGVDSLLCSKLIIVFFWMVASSIIGFLCITLLLINATPVSFEEWRQAWTMLLDELSRIPVHTIILTLAAMIMDLLKSILLVYFAIAAAHSRRFNAQKVIFGIIFYIALSTVLNAVQSYVLNGSFGWQHIFENPGTGIFAADSASSRKGVFNATAQDFQNVSMYMLRVLAIGTAYVAALYTSTRYFISQKLNIE